MSNVISASWVAAFFATANIGTMEQVDIDSHHSAIATAINTSHHEVNLLIGETIASARSNGGTHRTKVSEPEKLNSALQGEGKNLLVMLYKHYGVKLQFKGDTIVAKVVKKSKAA